MRVIIIDDSREYMASLRRMLAAAMPDIEVTEYDPEQQGKPGPEFEWSLYDVLLLDCQLGANDDGLDWMTGFRARPGFPPTIIMTAAGDEYVAARAIKLGALDYIRKTDVSSEKICEMVNNAVNEGRQEREQIRASVQDKLDHDADIFRAVQLPGDGQPDGKDIGYRFVRLIGQGASSRVYLAERLGDRTTLVLKVIDVMTIKDPQVIKRFVKEARMIAGIESPYVVRFLEHGFASDYGYIAMEFFTRGDLKQRIEHGVTIADALNYCIHICLGLQAIHEAGIVHRDLKPGNIMFRSDDSLALADFGISKRLDETTELTKLGSVLGTPNYISPEQATGGNVDHRTDIYSVGVMLFEMLCGMKPFRADTAAALVYQHVHADIPLLPITLEEYQPLINRLLAKKPDNRYADAEAVISALEVAAAAASLH
ncbi:MAG: protein kinase [Gammaproteobacteria bacterium]|nr:protein kinase [Gammaproteobacteria bacterium]